MVERGGRVKLRVIPSRRGPALSREVVANINPSAIIFTDDWQAYKPLRGQFLDHRVINHSAGVYVEGDVHTNSIEGLFGKPTVINNVLSFAAVPYILAEGGKAYENYGMGRSRGTLPFQLAGNIKQGGLVEKAFGITLGQLINDFGGGTATGKPLRAVQVGGPLGAYLPASQLNLQMDYEAFAANGAMVGHGGVVVFDDSVDMAAQARFAMEFCAIESCGKCTPCRIGSTRGVEVIDKIVAGIARDENLLLLDDLCQTMTDGSLCAMGGLTPMPVQSAVKYFPEDFDRPMKVAAE
jgi:formate dehydrogenase iron-sulfur subunit